jgi:hypothetical protein
MLKRPRPSSPSPFAQTPDLPLTSSDPTPEHGAKRRRICGPPLDGPSRGWGPVFAGVEDEEDEDDIMEGCTPNSWVNKSEPSLESTGEYKTANSLLHDLHAEQQHRRFMSSSSHLTSPPSPPFSNYDWSRATLQQPNGKPTFVIHPHPNPVQDTPLYEKYHRDVHTNGTKEELHCDERSVYKRYEEANR